jgi:hypothetical protein
VPAPAATLDKVRYRLLDTDETNPLLTSADTLEEAIVNAVAHYSQDRPRTVTADVPGNGTPFYALTGATPVLASWTDGYSRVLWIDYPATAISASYTPTYLSLDDDVRGYESASVKYLWLPNHAPTASQTVRISYTARHTHTAATNGDTVPAGDLDALCDLAAHYGCLALATRSAGSSDSTISADSVNYRDSQLRYRQQAEAWLASYQRKLGIASGDGRDGGGRVPGASATGDWDRRMQGHGYPWLTHGGRLR